MLVTKGKEAAWEGGLCNKTKGNSSDAAKEFKEGGPIETKWPRWKKIPSVQPGNNSQLSKCIGPPKVQWGEYLTGNVKPLNDKGDVVLRGLKPTKTPPVCICNSGNADVGNTNCLSYPDLKTDTSSIDVLDGQQLITGVNVSNIGKDMETPPDHLWICGGDGYIFLPRGWKGCYLGKTELTVATLLASELLNSSLQISFR
jgi:hypothetical protein